MTDDEKKLIIRLEQLEKFRQELLGVAYQKPADGIPATDMAQAVQDALSAAGTALQASDINQLEADVQALQVLMTEDAQNPTAAIDKFNEIVAFLNNITNTQTLESIVNGINTSIGQKYTKPTGGIPKSDLASAVQTSLGKADTALQSVPATYKTDAQNEAKYVQKDGSKVLSTNDYTAADKAKVDALAYATNDDIHGLFTAG